MDESDVLQATFYGAIDVISQAIENRFDQDDFRKLISISNCLIGAANKELGKDVKDKLACNSEPIKLDVLIEELQELPTYIKLHNRESGIPIKRVSKIQYSPKVMGHFAYFQSVQNIRPPLPLNNVGFGEKYVG